MERDITGQKRDIGVTWDFLLPKSQATLPPVLPGVGLRWVRDCHAFSLCSNPQNGVTSGVHVTPHVTPVQRDIPRDMAGVTYPVTCRLSGACLWITCACG